MKTTSIFTLAIVILAGVVIANLVVNPDQVKALFGFISKVWKWAIDSMMGNS